MLKRLLKKPDPVEQAKEWKQGIRREARQLERDIKRLEREEQKVVREVKQLSKEGSRNEKAIRILAKQIVQTRRGIARLYEGRAQLNSVQMQLQNQIAIMKVAGCIKSSAEVMAAMNEAVKIPEVQKNMLELAREMERAGLVEEIIADGLETLENGAEIEEEADAEVDRILAEITGEQLEGAAAAPTLKPKVEVEEAEEAPAEAESEALDETQMNEMRARLAGL